MVQGKNSTDTFSAARVVPLASEHYWLW